MNGISQSTDTGRFILVVGIGHCGTGWLANALASTSAQFAFYHQALTERFEPDDWHAKLQWQCADPADARFDSYWAYMRDQQTQYPIVGDSNSWAPCVAPRLAERGWIDGAIYLVRNGIQNLHSLHEHNRDLPDDDWMFEQYLRKYWQMIGAPGDWRQMTRWQKWCCEWQANADVIAQLRHALGESAVRVHRLEDLTTDVEALASLVEWLDPGHRPDAAQLRACQQRDVGRKITGDRTPQTLWGRWTPDQRAAFRDICATGMHAFGYDMPDADV